MFVFSIRGFRDAITFKKVDEAQINAVENFIRTQMPGILANWKTSKGANAINDEDFFGEIHVFDPSGFEFSEGDRIQIEAVASYVRSIMDDPNRGPQYFAISTQKAAKPNYKQVGHYFGANATNVVSNVSKQNTSIDTKKQLFTNVRAVLKKKGVNNNEIKQFTQQMVVVTEHQNGNPTASIECVLCEQIDGVREPQNVQSKVEGDPPKIYWILSNFSKHIERHNKKLKLDEPKINASNSSSINSQNDSYSHSAKLSHESIEEIEVSMDENGDIVEEIVTVNDSTIFLQIEQLSESFSIENVQSLIYDQISEQLNDMLEISLKHNIEENDMAFKIDNEEFTLQFAQIDADGNCMFAALTHQLSKTRIGSRSHSNAVSKLRKDVVKYIKSHRSEFEHELKGRIYEQNELNGKKTENIENAWQHYLEKELPKNGEWGGSETLKAVTRMKFVNILIMNAKGEGYFPYDFNMKLKQTVILAFESAGDAFSESAAVDQSQSNDCDASDEIISNTERNHYNSVVRMEQSDIYTLSQMLATIAYKRITQEQVDMVELMTSASN